jgi:hypothetical protein
VSPTGGCPHTETIRNMERVIWQGDNNKAPLVSLEGRMTEVEKEQSSLDSKFWAIIVLLFTILGGLVVDMVKHS